MKKVLIAVIICAMVGVVFANDMSKLRSKAFTALHAGNAAEYAAWMQAMEAYKRLELIELEKEKLALEIRFYQRSENLWKVLPVFLKHGQRIIGTIDPDEKKAHSDSSIFFKITDTVIRAINTGAVNENDLKDIGQRIQKSEEELNRALEERRK